MGVSRREYLISELLLFVALRSRLSHHRSSTVTLNSRTTTLQKCEAVPRRAGVQGFKTCVSLSSRLKRNTGEKEDSRLVHTALRCRLSDYTPQIEKPPPCSTTEIR